MTHLYNKIARVFYQLAYRALLTIWFFTRPTIHGVYIAIWYEERLLVIKNSYKKRFTIPCGRVKRGEDLVVAAARELYEEVNIRLETHQLNFVGEYSTRHNYAIDVGSFFEIELTEPPPLEVDNREVVWARFLTLDQVAELDLNPTVKTWLANR